MRDGTLAMLAVGLFLVVPARPAVAQQCVPYEPDPRLEAQLGTPALTQADALVTLRGVLHPGNGGSDPGTLRMDVYPWTHFHASNFLACPARDYHGQLGPGTLGSGVLVGSNLVLTAGHLFDGVSCADMRFVFGFGNFTPDQWQCASDTDPCTVDVPEQDVYSCQSVVRGVEDWAVVTLDRPVQGRTPLPILREPPFPPASTPVTVVGHPNRILMKVEYAAVSPLCSNCVDAHILHGSSGSMVVDEASGKVIGVVSTGAYWLKPGCEYDSDPPCYREWFGNPTAFAQLTPAWLAGGSIP